MARILFFAAIISFCAAHAIPSSFNSLPSNIHARDVPKLKAGSWLITYKPTDPNSQLYKGPLRITSNDTSTFISGDLYNGTVQPNPADGSPILPRSNYWAFIKTTKLSSGSNGGFSLGMEYWAYKGIVRRPYQNETVWADAATDGGYVVDLTPATAPSGYPDAQNYFEGTLKIASTGAVMGKITMGWVSTYLRRITVEIGTVSGVPVPEKDISGTRAWKDIFNEFGYDITLEVGKTDIPEPSNPDLESFGQGFWKNEQEHDAVLKYRKPTDFDKEWRYYLLVVRRMWEVARGAMIDTGGEYNSIPREGTCIASEWLVGTYPNGTIDNSDPWPEAVRGKKFVDLHDAWYRTAVHEVGHMFNIGHPPGFFGDLMTDTQTYVDAGADGTTAEPFPENIKPSSFQFLDDDKFLMQHRPDTFVRPGWINYGSAAQVS